MWRMKGLKSSAVRSVSPSSSLFDLVFQEDGLAHCELSVLGPVIIEDPAYGGRECHPPEC